MTGLYQGRIDGLAVYRWPELRSGLEPLARELQRATPERFDPATFPLELDYLGWQRGLPGFKWLALEYAGPIWNGRDGESKIRGAEWVIGLRRVVVDKIYVLQSVDRPEADVIIKSGRRWFKATVPSDGRAILDWIAWREELIRQEETERMEGPP